MAVDTDQLAQALSTDAPSTPSAPNQAASEGAATPGGSTVFDEAFWARLAEADPDEIVKRSPALQGKVGNLAQRQAEKLTRDQMTAYQQQIAAQRAADEEKAERQLRRELASTDPDKLAELELERQNRLDRQDRLREQREAAEQAMARDIQAELDALLEKPNVAAYLTTLTPSERQAIHWGNYTRFSDFASDLLEKVADWRTEQKAESRAKSRISQALKDQRIEELKSEMGEGTDLGVGATVTGGRIFTTEDIAAMSVEEFRKNEKAIDEQAARGLIRPRAASR